MFEDLLHIHYWRIFKVSGVKASALAYSQREGGKQALVSVDMV